MLVKWKIVALALPALVLAACKDEPTAALQHTRALAADDRQAADAQTTASRKSADRGISSSPQPGAG